jgi:fructose-1,6-bisphosphatase/inositol monophosphatase family enzyme
MIKNRESLTALLRKLHRQIQEAVVAQAETTAIEVLSAVEGDDSHYEGDTIFAIDKISEARLIEFFEKEVAPEFSLVLIAEGLHDVGYGAGKMVLPQGISEESAEIRVIVDPIDGTRCIMYQKRSGWILTGVAPNKGEATGLRDIEIAVQTEIPLVKQFLCDELWAFRGEGFFAERYNRLTGETTPLKLRPSQTPTIEHGYANISRFFPGARETLAAIDEEIVFKALGAVRPGKTHCFEDQYTSSAGQLYELISGHDRFIADLRPYMEREMTKQGLKLGICCHPYDLATVLIAEEAGVIVTDGLGNRLNAPLSVEADVAWAGYANPHIQAQIEPHLIEALRIRDLI